MASISRQSIIYARGPGEHLEERGGLLAVALDPPSMNRLCARSFHQGLERTRPEAPIGASYSRVGGNTVATYARAVTLTIPDSLDVESPRTLANAD